MHVGADRFYFIAWLTIHFTLFRLQLVFGYVNCCIVNAEVCRLSTKHSLLLGLQAVSNANTAAVNPCDRQIGSG